MAKLKNPLFSFEGHGKLGDIVLRHRQSTDIAEKTPVLQDVKSANQLSWRTMFEKCTLLWHTLSAVEKASWESLATPKHMTGYALWQSQCLRPNPGIYLPLAGGTMQGNIDMDSHAITDLPDPTANQDADTKAARDAAIAALHITEGYLTILPCNYSSIGAGTWSWALVAGQLFGGVWYNSVQANLDNISYQCYLHSGTYSLRIIAYKDAGGAIIDIDIDATEVASFDCYNAGSVFNFPFEKASIVIATSGTKTLRIRVHGRTPPSAGWGCYLTSIGLWRAA